MPRFVACLIVSACLLVPSALPAAQPDERPLAGASAEQLARQTQWDIVVATVAAVSDHRPTHAAPPLASLDVHEVIRGDGLVRRRQAVYPPLPFEPNLPRAWSESPDPAVLDRARAAKAAWSVQPMTAPRVGQKMILFGWVQSDDLGPVFRVSPVGRFAWSAELEQAVRDAAAAAPVGGRIPAPSPIASSSTAGMGGLVQQQASGSWRWFTGTDRALAPLLGDPREATSRIGVLADFDNGSTYFDAQIGGDVVLLERQPDRDHRFTVSGRGLFTVRLDTTRDEFPPLNSDYIGGVAVGYRFGRHEVEGLIFHESSHLGDETLESGERPRIDSSREALRLLYAYRPIEKLRLYVGPTFNWRGWPDEIRYKTTIQAGAEYLFSIGGHDLYAALDLQSREQNDWSVNVTAETGIFLGSPDDQRHRARLFLQFFHGNSNMGQYWDRHETYLMLGLGYDF